MNTAIKRFLPLLVLFLLCRQSFGQSSPAKIDFLRPLPLQVSTALPRGAKSHFWGTFELRPKEPRYGVNLYELNWRTNNKKWTEGQPITMYLNLFHFSENTWQLVRRCTIQYKGYSARRMRIGMDLLWLEPGKRQKPIFRIRAFAYESMGRQTNGAGDEVLVTFPNGFKGKYAVQNFMVGYWRASDTLGAEIYYGRVDKRGLLQLQIGHSLNEDGNPFRTTIYEWHVRKFVKISSYKSKG